MEMSGVEFSEEEGVECSGRIGGIDFVGGWGRRDCGNCLIGMRGCLVTYQSME